MFPSRIQHLLPQLFLKCLIELLYLAPRDIFCTQIRSFHLPFFFFTECFVHIFDLHILLKNASVVAFSNRWSQQLIMKPLLSEILVILSKNDCRLMVELPQLSTEL